MMNGLNIDTFNETLETLLQAAKDEESKIKILEVEIGMTADVFYSEVAELLDELEKNGYTSERFQRIINIKDNIEHLLEMFEEMKAKAEGEEG